jgi:hypothetical protein
MPIAIVLVLIGIITLAVGVFSAAVGWVYVSIGATALAGVVLFVVHRSGRRRPPAGREGAAPTGAPPIDVHADGPAVDAPSVAPPGSGAGAAEEPGAPADSMVARRDHAGDDRADGAFPIAAYDELRVTEVLPLLASLDAAALAEVRVRETRTKCRATVLARIDELLRPAEPGGGADRLRPTADAADPGRPDGG